MILLSQQATALLQISCVLQGEKNSIKLEIPFLIPDNYWQKYYEFSRIRIPCTFQPHVSSESKGGPHNSGKLSHLCFGKNGHVSSSLPNQINAFTPKLQEKKYLVKRGTYLVYCGKKNTAGNMKISSFITIFLKLHLWRQVFLSQYAYSEVGIRNIPMPLRKCVQILVVFMLIKCWSYICTFVVQHMTAVAFSCSLYCRIQFSTRGLNG